MNTDVIPPIELYRKYLNIASIRFNISLDGCRNMFGLFTIAEWENLFTKPIIKTFNLMYNIGKVKYVINYHDGVQIHKDGSPFFGIYCFNNKKKLNAHIKQLVATGYKQTN